MSGFWHRFRETKIPCYACRHSTAQQSTGRAGVRACACVCARACDSRDTFGREFDSKYQRKSSSDPHETRNIRIPKVTLKEPELNCPYVTRAISPQIGMFLIADKLYNFATTLPFAISSSEANKLALSLTLHTLAIYRSYNLCQNISFVRFKVTVFSLGS